MRMRLCEWPQSCEWELNRANELLIRANEKATHTKNRTWWSHTNKTLIRATGPYSHQLPCDWDSFARTSHANKLIRLHGSADVFLTSLIQKSSFHHPKHSILSKNHVFHVSNMFVNLNHQKQHVLYNSISQVHSISKHESNKNYLMFLDRIRARKHIYTYL